MLAERPRTEAAAGGGVEQPTAAARRVARTGVTLALAAVAAQTLAHTLNAALLDRSVFDLDVDAEGTPWSWASTTATGFAAGTLLALAVVGTRDARALTLVAAAVAFFSLDDAILIHEALSIDLPGVHEDLRFVWPALYAPLMLGVLVTASRVAGRWAEQHRRMLHAGLGLLVAAVAAEVAWGVIGELMHTSRWAYDVQVVVEEGLELGAWILVATAVLAELVHRAPAS